MAWCSASGSNGMVVWSSGPTEVVILFLQLHWTEVGSIGSDWLSPQGSGGSSPMGFSSGHLASWSPGGSLDVVWITFGMVLPMSWRTVCIHGPRALLPHPIKSKKSDSLPSLLLVVFPWQFACWGGWFKSLVHTHTNLLIKRPFGHTPRVPFLTLSQFLQYG